MAVWFKSKLLDYLKPAENIPRREGPGQMFLIKVRAVCSPKSRGVIEEEISAKRQVFLEDLESPPPYVKFSKSWRTK